ncbi:class I SAM-dependent methyltransferase [Micromonospora sp. L31]|uniref:class I SAM-dependent methyltransferase n=1 Tax=Micromonospora sp. L31 TaxID=3452213 RepID=UPI003F8A4250
MTLPFTILIWRRELTNETYATAWNDEYGKQGIPSSHRDEPSGVVQWALANVGFVTKANEQALDLGCGTGRNALALARSGYSVTGIDFSPAALSIARSRPGADQVKFVEGSVTDPLPVADNTCGLLTDIFVYFHQLGDEQRRKYREEMRRVLRPDGVLIVSLATDQDGYYAQCPRLDGDEQGSSVALTYDPHARVGNILLSTAQFLAEFSDFFELSMTWHKRKMGIMHGREYLRHTVAALWVPKS